MSLVRESSGARTLSRPGVSRVRNVIAKNKAQLLKAVGPKNEAQTTKILADMDTGIGEKTPVTVLGTRDSLIRSGGRWLGELVMIATISLFNICLLPGNRTAASMRWTP